jgi:hypothetical protein
MVLSAQMPLRIINYVRAMAKAEDRTVSFVMRRIMESWYAADTAEKKSKRRAEYLDAAETDKAVAA